ncbi:MAG: hydroxymyristoyl-ACP dehydratase [Legionellaceae bacterium]|nr:hydroxymyristoyl-ACP dehydratase [Legionellaceae bacterium]
MVPGEYISGLKHVTAEDAYLSKNSQGQYYFRTALVGETLGQLAAWNVMSTLEFTKRPVAGIASEVLVHGFAPIGSTIALESFIDRLDDDAVAYHSIATIEGKPLCEIKGALGPLLPMQQFSDPLQVKNQFDQIYRPREGSPVAESESESLAFDRPEVLRLAPEFTFDKVLSFEVGISLRAEKHVSLAAPYFPDHFALKPVLPMTVLIESSIHLAQFFIKKSGMSTPFQVRCLRKMKMNDFISPGDIVTANVQMRSCTPESCVIAVRHEVSGKRVGLLELELRNCK